MIKCEKCGRLSSIYQGKCPHCLTEGSLKKEPVAINYSSPDSNNLGAKEIYKTGFAGLNELLGGGLAPGRGYFLHGRPGIGKTSLLLQILATFQESQKMKTVFFSNEETKTTIAEKNAKLGTDCTGIDFRFDNILSEIAAYIREKKPGLIILDSFQTVTSSHQSQVEGAKLIKRLCNLYNCAFIVVGHETKGENFAGAREIEHDLDVVIEMAQGQNGEIILKTPHKNRTAGTGKRLILRMTSRGLVEKAGIETGFLLRHQETEAIGIAAFCTEIGGDLTVDEITVTTDRVSVKPKLSLVGAPPKQAEYLASVIMASFKDFLPAYIAKANRPAKLPQSSDLACVIATLSVFYKKPIPLDTVFMASLDASGKLLPAAGDMERMADRAVEQGYKRIIGPKAIGSQVANWEEADCLIDVWKGLGY
jgi:DNA repair protein RadA/Sms